MSRVVSAQRGNELRCRNWRAEGLLRMLENVLEVGQDPDNLIVYASLAKAARNWESYDAIRDALLTLADDESLVIQSGKPIAVFRTSTSSPIVIMANNNTVGRFATPEVFYERADRGDTVWGGLTAGAWQYIGAQGVLQGFYEVLQAVAREHFSGLLVGRTVLTAGLGGMGSAQPLAIAMSGAAGLVVEIDRTRLYDRLEQGFLDEVAPDLESALNAVGKAALDNAPYRVGLCGNAASVYTEIVDRGFHFDVVTDMTAAHDLRYGYVPAAYALDEWKRERNSNPQRVIESARSSIATEARALLAFREAGSVVFENGNNLRVEAQAGGVESAFEIDGFMERYIRPLFCDGIGPFRWVALSGDANDLVVLDDLASALFSERPEVARWIELARTNMPIQGLPARSCWLGHLERSRFALATNALVASGDLSAPVLFSRDHLDAAGMTHPFIGTERMADGSDAVSDWPLLDALLLCSAGADLVAVHGGGGGYSGLMQSAGVSIVADGSQEAAERLQRGLDGDTGLGVARYAEAGYQRAQQTAEDRRVGRVSVLTNQENTQ